MLIYKKPVKAARPEAALLQAAQRPLSGLRAGAFLCAGVPVGSLAGRHVAGSGLPRLPWAGAASARSAVRSGYQPVSRTQFKHMALINPVTTGGLGPHPVREPEPV